MRFVMSRRRFILLSGLSALGAGGYGLARGVWSVRSAASRLKEE
jgi:hypothetical protein